MYSKKIDEQMLKHELNIDIDMWKRVYNWKGVATAWAHNIQNPMIRFGIESDGDFGNGGNEKKTKQIIRTEFFVWFELVFFFAFRHIHFYVYISVAYFSYFAVGTEFLFSILCDITVYEYVVGSNLNAFHSLFVLSIRCVLSFANTHSDAQNS